MKQFTVFNLQFTTNYQFTIVSCQLSAESLLNAERCKLKVIAKGNINER